MKKNNLAQKGVVGCRRESKTRALKINQTTKLPAQETRRQGGEEIRKGEREEKKKERKKKKEKI